MRPTAEGLESADFLLHHDLQANKSGNKKG